MRESVCAHLQALSTAGRDGACDVPDRPAVGNALSPRSDIGRPPRSPSRCSRLCSTTPSLREIPQSIRRIHLLIRRRNSVRLNTQGLLQHLAINHCAAVWRGFRSWLRTMNPAMPPSELIVASALRSSIAPFFLRSTLPPELAKIIRAYRRDSSSPQHEANQPMAA